ncbi:MAG: hypothetical protein K6B14_02445 [Lachnospiraceae bacterium]|nr:hypothetical protein [Lachnospiraceae bacterium]
MNEQTKKKYNRQRRLQQQKKARQRQLMKMRLAASLVVVIIAVLLVLALSGAFEKRAEVSTMTVSENQVVYEEVAPIGDLDFKELKAYVKEETADADGVKLIRIAKKDGNAYVRTAYEDMAAYSRFTGYEGFMGTVADARRAGYDFDTVFSVVKDGAMGDKAKGKTVKKEDEAKVLIIRENGRFVVDGDIIYVSSENMSVIDGSTVEVTQSEGEEDATVLSYIVYE